MMGIWIPHIYVNYSFNLSTYLFSLDRDYIIFIPPHDILYLLMDNILIYDGRNMKKFSPDNFSADEGKLRFFLPYIPEISLRNVSRKSGNKMYYFGKPHRIHRRLSINDILKLGEKNLLGSGVYPMIKYPGELYGILYLEEDKLFSSLDQSFIDELMNKRESGRGKSSSKIIFNCYLLSLKNIQFHIGIIRKGRIRDVFS